MKVEDKKGKKYVSSLLYIKAQKSKGQLSQFFPEGIRKKSENNSFSLYLYKKIIIDTIREIIIHN